MFQKLLGLQVNTTLIASNSNNSAVDHLKTYFNSCQNVSSVHIVVFHMCHDICWYQNLQSNGVDAAQAGDVILQYWLPIFRKRLANDYGNMILTTNTKTKPLWPCHPKKEFVSFQRLYSPKQSDTENKLIWLSVESQCHSVMDVGYFSIFLDIFFPFIC